MMMMMNESMTSQMQTAMNDCMECHKMCMETMAYCMSKGGKHMDMTMMCIMRDCSEMCMMCTNMIMSGSELMGRTCMLCAEICDACGERSYRCATACEKMSDDRKMMECAAACRKCAESCRSMQMMPV